ncbi:MAG: hypothetical protein OXE99_09980 [Cellvibrionales bacterium]|nr:hypothetical protein [Cellvibrionales bacterium]
MAFFPFLFNTIQKRANDKTNTRFWLPGVLQDVDNPNGSGKLLPLRDQSWSLGKIEGQTGQTIALSIIGAARSLVGENEMAGPDMSDPYPSLAVQQGEILGLDNLFLYPNPETLTISDGYQTRIEFKFNEYADLAKLGLKGNYQLDQNIEVNNLTTGEKTIKAITGTGSFESTITNAKLAADVKLVVEGEGANRQAKVEIVKLDLISAAEGSNPVFHSEILSIDAAEPGYESIWLTISNNAFNSSSASTAMLASITEAINEPDKLVSLSEVMTTQLENTLKSLTGDVTSLPSDTHQSVENVGDLYIYDRFRVALNLPTSPVYLPKLLTSLDNPKLEPLSINELSIGSQNIAGLNWSPNVLTQIVTTGLANNLAPADDITLKEPVLYLTTTQELLTGNDCQVDGQTLPEGPLVVNAAFSFTPPAGIAAVTGNLTLRISNSHLVVSTTANGTLLDNLQIVLKSLQLQVALTDIQVDITVTSDSMMNSMASTIANKDSVKQKLVDQLNDQLNSQLSSISQELSKAIVSFGINALDN